MNPPSGRNPGTRLRWGLVGCGDIVQKRVGAALSGQRDGRLVCVARARAEAARECARSLGAERWHERWEDLVRDPGIDAVYVATPVALHAPVTIAAAQAGKHVLCEKPMALTVEECDRMISVCRDSGVRLGIAYYRRYYPIVHRLRTLLQSQAVGKPVLAQVNAFESFSPAPDGPRGWFLDPAQAGGGPMFDFGCHRIELLLHMLGPVTGAWGELARDLLSHRVEDTAVAVLRFDSGTRATITVTHAAAEPQDTLSIYCTQGSLHVPVLNRERLLIRTPAGDRTEDHPPPANFHAPLVDAFTAAVLAGRDPDISGESGREVNRLLDLVYHSRPGPAPGASRP